MKILLRSIPVINYQFFHLHIKNNFRFRTMFSTRSQILGIGLNIIKNFNKSRPELGINRRIACSYFSVKVDVGGNIQELEKVPRESNNFIKVGEPVNFNQTQSKGLLKQKIKSESSALVMKLKILTKTTNRDVFVIQNICDELLNMDLKLNVKEYIDILYCLSVLNIHNEELLMKLLKIISALLHQVYKPSPLINTVSKCMRNLLLRHTETLDEIINWFSITNGNLETSSAAGFIETLAVLNYFPAKADILLQKIFKSDMVEYSSTIRYLNFVWAVTLIDRVHPDMAESVLVPFFRKKLESFLGSEARISAHLKLFNIQAHANIRKFTVKMDSNWLSAENIWLNKMKDKRRKNPLIRNLIECLSHILPSRTYNTFVDSRSGSVIDAVCFFDNNHSPITELEFVKKNGIRVAVILLSFKDLCSPEKKEPNGIVEFHKRFLIESNYKILFINYKEFPVMDNLRRKTNYLKNQIQSVLPNYGKDE